MGSLSEARKKKRFKLFREQNGLCYYCKRKMVLHQHYSNQCMGPMSATFEHLFMKGDPYRGTPNHSKEKRVVLACYECNHNRINQWKSLEK